MGTERMPGRGRRVVAALVALAWLPVMPVAAATAVPSPSGPVSSPAATPASPVPPGQGWWVPLGLRGHRITALSVGVGRIEVSADGRQLVSSDGGASFVPGSTSADLAPAPIGVQAGSDVWEIRDGTVLHGVGGGTPAVDPGGPDLGPRARLIAAPAALPGQVLAVSDAGVVWRRTATGSWGRSLVLLPQSLIAGRPSITALSGFAEPLSTGVYLGTDGYSVLLSTDGGDSWVRAGPGLPDTVLALTSDPQSRAVYAGTDDGIFVHRLRALPSIPVYAGADLTVRRLGTAGITAMAIAVGIAVLAVPWSRLRPWLRRGRTAR